MNGRDLARDTYAGIDMRWLEQPRRLPNYGRPRRRHPEFPALDLDSHLARAHSIVVPWYAGQRRVKSLVGTDVRVKRVA